MTDGPKTESIDTGEPAPVPEASPVNVVSTSPHSSGTVLTSALDIDDDTGDDELSEDQPLPADRYLDRELSWLSFNERVLELAEDEGTPLLARARFLAIFASNLDEFFMVRVAGLKRRIAAGFALPSSTGMSPTRLVEALTDRAHHLMDRHADVFEDQVLPQLQEQGIHLVHFGELEEAERERLRKLFRSDIFPVLTPLAVDPAHPFPYISGLSLNLAVELRDPDTLKQFFARVKVPETLPRFLSVDSAGRAAQVTDASALSDEPRSFVPLEDVIEIGRA